MEQKRETVSEIWEEPSLPDDPLEEHTRNLLSATEAWQCDRCGRWICNDCILPLVIRSRARRMRHRGCGGVFKAPDAPPWIGVVGQRPVPSGSWKARFGIRTALSSAVFADSSNEPIRKPDPDGDLRLKEFALIAKAIHRSIGIALPEDQLIIGLAMCDQLEGRRRNRAKRTIETLSAPCTDRELSLAAALPAFLYTRGLYIRDTYVHVLAPNLFRAREDAQLYHKIDRELGGPGVGLVHADQPRPVREAAFRCGITVGDYKEFERRDVVRRDAAIIRVDHYESGHLRAAHLPGGR
ncbi:hypothetical protein [Streptomyces sp. NL15-2K]|uniref:hypothetical protein n=1 Tax=Streptomyces sp. NL15-2K TaxID=376149 RepID=UPI000F56D836|nr:MULTISPECIES: hypothetical protein [Actinomycetes]WKX11568.1 hypothetical protein Q4V64_30280 [Kutzneria buriramensis]